MKRFKTTSLIIVISILIFFDMMSVAFSAKALPDLSVQSISGLPASVMNDRTFSINDSITNNGNKMSKAFTVRYYLSLDTIKSKKDILLSGKRRVKFLDYQITSSDVVNLTFPKKTPSNQYYLIACADATKEIKESNEINNCTTSNATINIVGFNWNYFPFAEGNAWVFQNTLTERNSAPVSYVDALKITGLKVINGVTTTVFTEPNYRNTGIKEKFYRLKDKYGITYYGDNDTDVVTSQLVPYQEYMLPLKANSIFNQIEKNGLNYGEDLDGDGKNESINMSSTVKVEGFETVDVQVGTFSDVAKIVTNITYTLVLSRNSSQYSIKEIVTEWFAPGIGPVKNTYIIKYPDKTKETFISELRGYTIDGQSKGIMDAFTVPNDAAGGSSNMEDPGRPSIGFDGTNYLVVSRRVVNWANSTMTGTIISGSGSILKTFDISSPGSNRSAVAFDGTNYLVVFSQNSQIVGYRVSPSGTVIDGPAGFTISTSNPFGATNYLPSVAFDGTNYMVVWNKYDSTLICSVGLCRSENLYDIYGARVTPAGQVLGEFPVFSAPGDQHDPSIAFDGTNYFVIWSDTRMGSSSFASEDDIYGTRVTTDAVVLDPSGIPISTASGTQLEPQIIFDGTNYFAVWLTIATDSPSIIPPPADLHGRRIMPDMTLLDGPLDADGIAIVTGGFAMSSPSVTFDGKDYLIAWSGSYHQYSLPEIFAARVSIEGSLIDAPSSGPGISISGYPPDYLRYEYPTVLFNGTSSLLTYGTVGEIEAVLIYPF
jgi:hypothetical protein